MLQRRRSRPAEALAADLIRPVQRFNRTTDGTMVLRSEYLDVIIKTRWNP